MEGNSILAVQGALSHEQTIGNPERIEFSPAVERDIAQAFLTAVGNGTVDLKEFARSESQKQDDADLTAC